MQRDDAAAQPCGEARERLRGERDLGDEHQRLAATSHGLGDEIEIDLGLAAAGDAIEQERPVVIEAGDGRVDRALLVVVERRARDGDGPRQAGLATAFVESAPRGAQGHGQRRGDHLADRVVVIACGESEQREVIGREQGLGVEDLQDAPEFQAAAGDVRGSGDHAHDLAASQRDLDARAGRWRGCVVGGEVVEGLRQGGRNGDFDRAARRHFHLWIVLWMAAIARA